ncbi:RNA polymerase sporulation sigma factor SigH [Peribacillus muralis]|uniref:RNA polymerase factor sigma-70 n=2 Tax=Peribacillus muralis TaxID=264697 RepID=A0A1B3XL64_9BACI|nr:RNA polymerase sporulation sigma factor SigH [Peribacillus muralis]AOH53961.1 RNA polymerase factor sigma-70 [Peribacillus muralis]
MSGFSLYDDISILELVRKGDIDSYEYLIRKYRGLVQAKARQYFLVGAEKEDIFQEGMIGLYKAIRDFKSDKQNSFKSFAELCIKRQIITAIKTASRQKHTPLNSYISLDKPIYDDDSEYTLIDKLPSKVMDPITLLIDREKAIDIDLKMSEILSDLEKTVLALYMDGETYQEISLKLDIHVKSIDNALQRTKKKLGKYLDNRERVV